MILAATGGDHSLQHRALKVQRPDKVDAYQFLPEFRVGLHEGPGDVPTGVVYQDVDGAERFGGPLHHVLHRGHVGDVERHRDGLALGLRQGLDHPAQRIRVQVGGDDGDAFLDQPLADCLTDAAGGAGQQCDASFQTSHVFSCRGMCRSAARFTAVLEA